MAFDLALIHSTDDDEQNIVVFTDCQDLLQMLAGEHVKSRPLGPVTSSGRWALADIYDAAGQLKRRGRNVVLAWIKDHRPGLGTEGNRKADHAASKAISASIKSEEFWDPSGFEVPAWIGMLYGDVREEALWRVSRPFFRWGTGECWVARTMREGNWGREEEDEEDDWTVYRPVMSLREAQEEDERESRQYLALEECKERGLPIRESIGADWGMRAEPLRHVYHRAKALPRQMKTVDYAKMYRKGLDSRLEPG